MNIDGKQLSAYNAGISDSWNMVMNTFEYQAFDILKDGVGKDSEEYKYLLKAMCNTRQYKHYIEVWTTARN